MDIKQLRAFVVIAQTGNVTRASAMLNVVQPAVSRYLRLLEEDVGVPLFDRTSQGMELTEAGTTLLDYAQRVLQEIERARAEIRPRQGSVGGIVNIGLLPSTCDLLCGELLAAVAKQHVGIQLRIATGDVGRLQSWLESGEIQAAILYDSVPSMTMQTTPLLEEEYWVVGKPDAGFTANTPVKLIELANWPLILTNASRGLRLLVNHAVQTAGLQLNIVAETNAVSVQRSLVLAGHGVTLLPGAALTDVVTRNFLIAAPLIEPNLVRRLVLALSTIRQTTASVRCVVDALLGCMYGLVQRGAWPSARWLAPDVKVIDR